MQRFWLRWSLFALPVLVILASAALLFRGNTSPARASVAAQGQTPVLSAVGTVHVQAPRAPVSITVNIDIQEQAAGMEIEAAVSAVQQRASAVQDALEASGIPAARLHASGIEVFTIFGGPGLPPGVGGGPFPPGPPAVQGFSVSQNFQVDTAGPEELVRAVRAAVDAGANSVNTFPKGGGDFSTPDPAILSPAIQQAAEQAEALLQEAARARGLPLGELRSLEIQAPLFIGTGPSTGFWRVQVTATRGIGESP